MASSLPSKNYRKKFRRAITLAPVLAIAGLILIAAIWGPTLSSAARMQPEKKNSRMRSEVAPAKQSGRLARESSMVVAPVPFATITVDRTDDIAAASACTAAANDCSLRGAIAFANLNPGTTINVPNGTYNLTISGAGEGFAGNNSVGDVDITATNTTIAGAGAGTTIIHQTTAGDRVVEVNPFLDPNFTTSITDVTISGGTESTGVGGGGIISGSIGNALTLTNCVVSGNSATGAGSFGGGGVSHSGGSLTITNCRFSGNSTVSGGGAIQYTAGDPFARTPSPGVFSVSGSTFSGNTANSMASGGGALDLFDFNLGTGSYSITASSFSGNNATNANGGAIVVESGGPFTTTKSSFSTNHAGASGGAIFSSGSSADIRFSRLVGNTATTPANGLTLFRGGGTFTANDNWWGVNTGPTANDFQSSAGPGVVTTYLQLRASASPNTICVGGTSTVTADIKQRNAGSPLTTELNGLPAFPASIINATPLLGSLSGVSANFVDGVATATFTASATGTASIDATADNETATATILIQANATTDPADQTLCAGATANFTTTASGPGPFSFVWKKGATVLNNGDLGGRVIITSGANTSTLSISSVQTSDADTYTVEATGACSTASQSASLAINAATTASDPADQTVCRGNDASFSTTAGGTGPFNYAWTVDGSPFGGNTSSITVPTGALSAGVHPVSVTVTGACNSDTQNATLTVQATTATTDPADQTVCQGATANFSTTASGTGPFSYAWTLDGSPFGGNTSSINVPTGSLSVGPHTVSVTTTGTCGSDTQSATLTVQATTATTDPADQTVCQGATANFSTTASGTGPFSYAWTVDGSPFGGNTSSISVPTGSLSVGNHTVSVTTTGTCGSASQSATLTVQATTATTDPPDQTVCHGAIANFSTAASGTGPFHYSWTLDGLPFNGDSPSISVPTGSLSQGAHSVSVTTTGSCGSASQTAVLTVQNGAPVITVGTPSISMWPPNHQYHTFNISDFNVTATSNCEGNITNNVVVASVTSDELDDNPGGADGSTINDIVIAGNCKSVQLRAERDGSLNGRVYTITLRVMDSVGNTSTATVYVTVPLNQNGGAAVNSGPQNVVNGTCP